MKEQFDKKLVEKIRDSFEHHEEVYDPKEWEKLSSAYFRPKKGLAKSPWMLWAASLVALLALSFLFFNSDRLQEHKDVAVLAPKVEERSQSKQGAIDEGNSNTLGSQQPNSAKSSPEENMTDQFQSNLYPKKDQEATSQKVAKIILPAGKETVMEMVVEKEFSTGLALTDSQKDRAEVKGNPPLTEQQVEKVVPLIADLRLEEEKKALEVVQNWLGNSEKSISDGEDGKVNQNSVKLGLMIAPQTISNSNQVMNLGGGIMSEFSFSKRLKLDVGLAYASQNISPNGQYFGTAMDVDSGDGMRLATLSNNLINASSELRFGQLEVPLNLKYRVLENKSSGIYLVSGLSNMFYLNQRNIYTYSSANIASAGFVGAQNMVQSFTETVRPDQGSDGAEIGQLINFGFGYEHNLSNGTFIYIEPFYKTSLGSQTFAGQQFSIGGINLRMNFQLKKQK
jgi:hypothetical protein